MIIENPTKLFSLLINVIGRTSNDSIVEKLLKSNIIQFGWESQCDKEFLDLIQCLVKYLGIDIAIDFYSFAALEDMITCMQFNQVDYMIIVTIQVIYKQIHLGSLLWNRVCHWFYEWNECHSPQITLMMMTYFTEMEVDHESDVALLSVVLDILQQSWNQIRQQYDKKLYQKCILKVLSWAWSKTKQIWSIKGFLSTITIELVVSQFKYIDSDPLYDIVISCNESLEAILHQEWMINPESVSHYIQFLSKITDKSKSEQIHDKFNQILLLIIQYPQEVKSWKLLASVFLQNLSVKMIQVKRVAYYYLKLTCKLMDGIKAGNINSNEIQIAVILGALFSIQINRDDEAQRLLSSIPMLLETLHEQYLLSTKEHASFLLTQLSGMNLLFAIIWGKSDNHVPFTLELHETEPNDWTNYLYIIIQIFYASFAMKKSKKVTSVLSVYKWLKSQMAKMILEEKTKDPICPLFLSSCLFLMETIFDYSKNSIISRTCINDLGLKEILILFHQLLGKNNQLFENQVLLKIINLVNV
jgi:hypothetical protein